MRIIVAILAICSISLNVYSQDIDWENDTLTDDFIEHLFFHKTKIEFRISTDKTFITKGVNARFTNLRLGVRFKKHYKFGLVMTTMRPLSFAAPENTKVNTYNLKFNGYGGYFEYVILKNYRFEVSAPFSILSMQAEADAFDYSNARFPEQDTSSNRFPVLSLGVYGGYSINYWLAIGLGFGYRQAFSTNDQNNSVISTPFYSLGLKIQLGNFYKSVFHKDQVLYMKSVYFRDRKPEKSAKQLRHSKNITARKNRRKNQ